MNDDTTQPPDSVDQNPPARVDDPAAAAAVGAFNEVDRRHDFGPHTAAPTDATAGNGGPAPSAISPETAAVVGEAALDIWTAFLGEKARDSLLRRGISETEAAALAARIEAKAGERESVKRAAVEIAAFLRVNPNWGWGILLAVGFGGPAVRAATISRAAEPKKEGAAP